MVEELETETQDPIPPLPKGFKVVKSDNGGDLPPLPKGYVQKKNPVGTGSSTGGTVGSSVPQSANSTNPFAIGGQYNQAQKPDFDKLDLSNTRHDAVIAEQIKNQPKKIPLTPILDNVAIKKPISEIDANEAIARNTQHKADMETAIDNTTLKVLKNKGIVAGKGSPYYEAERKKIEEKTKPTMIGGIVVSGPEATYHKDKNGNIGLDRNLGFLEDMRKSYNAAVDGEDEAKSFNGMTTEQKVQYANQKMQENPNPEYMSERSGVGGLIGGSVPYLVKAAAAATLATAAGIAAPETGGLSMAGAAPVLTVLLTAPDMIKQGAKDEIMARYMQLKQERPNISDEELMKIAEGGELSGSILGAANALAYTTSLKLPIAKESKDVLTTYLKGVASSAVHLGGITAGSKAAQLAERKLEGYNVDTDKAVDEVVTTFKDNATAGAVLNGLISGAHILPKVIKSAFKYSLKDTPTSEIKTALQANVDAGRIPPEVADQTIADINGYKAALAKTADGLKPETQASVAGLIQARDNVANEMATKDPTQRASYEQKIEAYNKQIEQITKTNDPLKYEVDEVTGNPLNAKPTPIAEPTFEDKVRETYPTLKEANDKDINDFAKENAADDPTQFISKFGQEKFDEISKDVPTKTLQDNLDMLNKVESDSPNVEIFKKLIADREEVAIPPPTEQQSGKDETQKLKDRKQEIESLIASDNASKHETGNGNLKGREELQNELDGINEKLKGGTNDIEAKKADIEKRRNEELSKVTGTVNISHEIKDGVLTPVIDDSQVRKNVKSINDKYDAELSALEKQQSGKDAQLSEKDLQDNGVSFIQGASHLAKENSISNEAAELQHTEAGNEIMAIVNDGLSKGKSGNEIVGDIDKIFNEKLRSIPSNTRAVIEQLIKQKASDLPSVLKEAEAIDAEIKSLREEDGSINNKEDIQKFRELRTKKQKLLQDAGVNDNEHLKKVISQQSGKDVVVDEGVVDKGISFDRKQQNDAYSGISDAENNDPKKTIGEYVASLFDSKNKGKGASQYYVTDRTINGKTVTVRVSDHSHLEGNKTDENGYTVSIVVNGEKAEGLTVNKDYAEINIKANKKNVEDKIHDLYDHFDEIEQKAKSLSTKPEIKNEEAQATQNTKQTEGTIPTESKVDEVIPTSGEGKEGGKEPPKEPAEPVGEDKGDKFEEKGILTRLYNAEKIPETAKEEFKDKLKYKPKSHQEAEQIAKGIVDEYGVNDAVTLAETGKLSGGVNSAVFAESLNRLFKMEQDAKTPQEKFEAAKKFAEVGIRFDEISREKGRDISQISHFYKKSPLGIKLMEEAKRKEAFDEFSKKKDQTWKEFFNEMVKEPEFEAIVKEEVKEQLKTERAEARKARIKKVDDIFDKAKEQFKGGAAYSTIIPPKLITGALEGMKQAYRAGEKVAKVIEDAIEYISKEIGGGWDKEKFRKEWQDKLGEYESKKEIPLDKREKILEKFRNKLKGLTEKEKDEVIRKSFKKLVENGALEYSDFKKIIGETLGYGELTVEQAKKITDLVNELNAVDDLATKARDNERSIDALKKYQDAKKKAEKSATELGKLVYNKPDVVKRLLSVMQLNTLGIPSLINNPIFNVFNQSTVRLPRSIIMTGIDYSIYGVGKLFGKDYKPENNVFHAQLEFYNKLGYGSKQSVEQLFTGLTNRDYFQKEVYASQIKPLSSIRELWAYSKGDLKLNKEQVIDKTIQATVGVPAEAIARVLNIGDKPQRFAAEGAQAAVFAKNLGLQGIDYKLFMEFPKEEAYRALKKQGLSDEAAMKKAEEIKERIISEGEESTFQQDNLLNDAITAAFKPFGKAGEAVKTLNMPFVKIPLNAFWSVYNLANPEVALLQSAVYGYRAIKSKSAADIQASKKWFAHAVTGMAWMASVGALAKAGIVNAPNPDDATKKEREGEQYYEQQNSVNMSKLMAYMQGKNPDEVKNGLNVDLKWLGNMGILMGYQAQKLEDMTPEQKENGIGYMEDMVSNLHTSALDFMDKGVFSNTGSLFTAINKGGSFMDNYLINLINMGTNIVQPAAFAQISRAQLPYYSKAKADTFMGQLKNNMLTRSSLLRNLTGQYPPSKIGIWGDKLEKKDNTMMRLFGISTASNDNFAQPIYEDYKKTNNTKFFPPSVKPEIRENGETVKLPPKAASELEMLVGQERKKLAAPYVNDMATFSGSNKKYSQLSDDEKIDKLRIIYEEGFKNGEYLFLQTHPEYKPKDKTKQQKREDKKESSANKKFRKSLK